MRNSWMQLKQLLSQMCIEMVVTTTCLIEVDIYLQTVRSATNNNNI